MISAATLRKLGTLGLSAEQMVGVLDLLADQMQADEERARAEEAKREKDRDRKRRVRGNSVDIPRTETGNSDAVSVENAETVSPSPVPPSSPPHPPNNPLTPKPIQKNSGARGFRLPDDWVLTGPDLAYALSKGFSEQQTGEIFEKFTNHWWSSSSKNAVKKNWHQAWRVWLLNEKPSARASPPFAKPLTEFQRKQQETNDVRQMLRNSAAAARSGGTPDRVLSIDHGGGPASVRGGTGGDLLDLSASPSGQGR